MGGGSHQVNSGQATGSYNAGQGAIGQDTALANSNAAFQKAMQDRLFGAGGKGGTLSGMMDPASLNTGAPTGAYKTAWNNSQNQIASDFANQKGSLAQSFANMGAGTRSTPNGFQADQMNKLSRGEADTRGATYTGLVGQQHQDALNNFWNANNLAGGQAANSTSASVGAAGNAGNTAANLYGVAGKQKQTGTSAATGITESALCPASGSPILMADHTIKKVEELRKGDKLLGIDGEVEELIDDPVPSEPSECVFVQTREFAALVSLTHTFARSRGGYAFAAKCVGLELATQTGPQAVLSGELWPEKLSCWRLLTSRSHTYNVGGIWSLE
jgi:hypothetical protein